MNTIWPASSCGPKDAVQLMTVHKSKGLEFKYVFILNMDKAFNRKGSIGADHPQSSKGIGFKYVANLPVETEKSGCSRIHSPADRNALLPTERGRNKIGHDFGADASSLCRYDTGRAQALSGRKRPGGQTGDTDWGDQSR